MRTLLVWGPHLEKHRSRAQAHWDRRETEAQAQWTPGSVLPSTEGHMIGEFARPWCYVALAICHHTW